MRIVLLRYPGALSLPPCSIRAAAAAESFQEWALLLFTAAYGGVRIYSQFALLSYTTGKSASPPTPLQLARADTGLLSPAVTLYRYTIPLH